MPTYQYACTACDERLEVVQSFTDDPLTECSSCGGRLRKVFSPVGVVFKGSGFYRTDSRASSNGSGTSGKTSETNGKSESTTSSEPAKDGASASDKSPASASKKSPEPAGKPSSEKVA